MTIAIVDLATGQFKHTTNMPVVEIDGINRRTDSEDRKQYGIFDFIPASGEAPAGKKAQGSTFAVDLAAGTVTETFLYVDMTQEEIKQATNGPLDAQIEALERHQLLPRITRDMHRMVTLQAAAAQGITEADLLDENHAAFSPGYKRFYDFDAQIAALRAQRV